MGGRAEGPSSSLLPKDVEGVGVTLKLGSKLLVGLEAIIGTLELPKELLANRVDLQVEEVA